jgi:hypothetical protein
MAIRLAAKSESASGKRQREMSQPSLGVAYRSGEGQYRLRHKEGFRITASAFHSADSHQAKKRLFVPPVAHLLRRIVLIEKLYLASPQLGGDGHIAVASAEVPIPLGDLVVKDEGVAPNGRGHRA